MIVIKVDGKNVEAPQEWAEVTLIDFINFFPIATKIPEKLIKVYQADKDTKVTKKDELVFLKFYQQVCEYWTKEDLTNANRDDVIKIYNDHFFTFVLGCINTDPPKGTVSISEFTFGDKTYKLGKKHMEGDRTWQEYAESKQAMEQPISLKDYYEDQDLDIHQEDVLNGKWSALPYVLAIMAREGEDRYVEEEVKKRVKIFQQLPMSIVWPIVFFLLNRYKSSMIDLARYSRAIRTREFPKAEPTNT